MLAEYRSPNLNPLAVKRNRVPWLGADGAWRVPLTRGQTALVDTLGVSLAATSLWHATPRSNGDGTFYAKASQRGFLHRLICPCPVGFEVDHINGDTLDCRSENLRVVSRSQQMQNRRTWGRGRYRGVSKRGTGYAAYIGAKPRYIGYFGTAEEAATAYDDVARELYGENACLNFPRLGERGAR